MIYRRYRVFFLLFLFNVIWYLDRINMFVAARAIADEIGPSPIAPGYLAGVSLPRKRHTLGHETPVPAGAVRAAG